MPLDSGIKTWYVPRHPNRHGIVMAQNTIAVIADCDDTLAPDTTAQLLRHFGVDPDVVFREAADLVKQGWDPAIAYMQCMIKLAEGGGPLSGLNRTKMEEVGLTLEFHPGIPEIFSDIKGQIEGDSRFRDVGIRVETYVVSSGIEELLNASRLNDAIHALWGSTFAYGTPDGPITSVKRSLSFTEKTRYIFLIQKGKVGEEFRGNPYVVNEPMDQNERPVPFSNMIYIGDGPSDIPCMSLIQNSGGHVIGILSKDNPGKTWALGYGRRANITVPPEFRPGEYAYNLLQEAIRNRAETIRQSLTGHRPTPKY